MLQAKCKDCGTSFEISDEEEKFFKSKQLTLPKRCKACRKANKERKMNGGDRR